MASLRTIADHTIAHTHFSGLAAGAALGQDSPAEMLRLQSVAFAHANVALAAKLAAVDGAVNTREFEAYVLQPHPTEVFDVTQLRSLFIKHVGDAASPLQYARQIAGMAGNNRAVREEIVQRLLRVATADAPLNAAEMELLGMVADIFGIQRERLRALVVDMGGASRSPHAVLGVSSSASAGEVRARYLALVQKLHPDRFQAAGASADTMAMLSDQLAELNMAYAAVKRGLGKKPTKAATVSRWWQGRNAKGAKSS